MGIVACLDVCDYGREDSRPMDLVWVEHSFERIFHSEIDDAAGFMKWVDSKTPMLIAIDAPSGENKGITNEPNFRQEYDLPSGKYKDLRLCEAILKKANIDSYKTTRTPANWVKKGWALYAALAAKGYDCWRKPGRVSIDRSQPTVIEVYPNASFTIGLGWRPRPKSTLAGQLEILSYLFKEQGAFDILFTLPTNEVKEHDAIANPCWPDSRRLNEVKDILDKADWGLIASKGIYIPTYSEDVLDALGGLITALKALTGDAYAVGHSTEGVIVLPGALKSSSYLHSTEYKNALKERQNV